MAKQRCNACGGVYDPALPDGTAYFHACAPTIDADTGATRPIKDARDENVVLDRHGHRIGIVADGAGVAPVEDDDR